MTDPLKMADPDNLMNYLRQLDSRLKAVERGFVNAESADQIVQDLGDQFGGRFIAVAAETEASEPTDEVFFGAFMSAVGEVFNGIRSFIGTVANGQLQAGFVEQGGIHALGGNLTIDSEGLSIYGLTLALYFEATFGGVTRRGFVGMNVPQGGTKPVFSLILTGPVAANEVSNGDFETGDLTGWTDSDSAWAVSATSPYEGSYAALHDGTLGIFGGELYQGSISCSAGDVVTVSFPNRRINGILAGKMKIEFLDGASSVLDTEYIYGATGPSWSTFSGYFLAPASTASARLTWIPGDPFNDEAIDNVEFYATDTIVEVRLADDSLTAHVNGVEHNLLGAGARKVRIFADEMSGPAGAAVEVDTAQLYNMRLQITAANAADGDEYTASFYIDAGTYDIITLGVATSANGKVDTYIDDVLVDTGQDWYSGSTTQNVKKTVSSIAMTGGEHTIKVKVNGKHASSTDYRYLPTMWLIK